MSPKTNQKVLDVLGKIFQAEMAGIIRYLHYSFMIMGYNRIPIQKWFRDQATESTGHAIMIGEKITSLGGHPPMLSSKIEETNEHSIPKLLEESLIHEREALSHYQELVKICGDDVALDELARQLLREETEHIEEVEKMLKNPN
jgi:bacterioferritin